MITEVLTLATGPAGTVIVCLLILYGIYKLVDKHVLPAVKEWFQNQDERFEKIMNEHAEDRKVFKEGLEVLAGKLQVTDEKVDKLVGDVEEIKKEITQHIAEEERILSRI